MTISYLPNPQGVQAWFQTQGFDIGLEDAARFLALPDCQGLPWPERLARLQAVHFDGRVCRALGGQMEAAGVLYCLMHLWPTFPGRILDGEWLSISHQAIADQTALTVEAVRDAWRQLSAAGAISRAMRPGARGVCIRVNRGRVAELIEIGQRLPDEAAAVQA